MFLKIIHSDSIGIYAESYVKGLKAAKNMENCYIYGKKNAVYMEEDSFIEYIKDSVLISVDDYTIQFQDARKNSVREFLGNTIVYSQKMGPISAPNSGLSKGWLRVDVGSQSEGVSPVRFYGPMRTDWWPRFTLRDGYHMENTNPEYNKVDNSRIRIDGDADFTGIPFYYVIRNN